MTEILPPAKEFLDLPLSRAALDRSAHLRTQPEELERRWADPRTRVLRLLPKGRFLVDGDPPALVLVAPREEALQRSLFLGLDDADVAYYALLPDDAGADGADDADDERAVGLRDVGALLGARDVGLAVNAVALANWHATHTHCPRCGAPTRVTDGGHVRVCEADGTQHYPRTDPAVIMAIVDEADRLLLGRQASWPEGRFSTLAGFVEPGESLEQAVRREVAEEVGVSVGDVVYLASQAWPFPASIMLGFVGRALTTELHADRTEIEQARWVTREELGRAVDDGSLLLPPGVSIARKLIEHWYGATLDAEVAWR
ncbi:NAD+ diphosphatase [Motilibacter rhizosphaerae]|uniref:NAD(+) diphosphatase n=1 Tax=Motilibacter rhizosphaerae TaxID=598652 RepID=A0A4Q7NQB9_9ACTN|nr:NAD(+) diphosphatase [Motilibacter rhizosphaerae]RZS87196.1 NAD+ diphosphatase [Motilibacter rhizosphaerae]